MKIFKTILKSIGILLAGAVALTSCQNNIDNSEEAYLKFEDAKVSRNVVADYEITDFNYYTISGIYKDYYGVTPDSVSLGNWSTYEDMLNAYIPIPNTGNWTFTLEASKSGTIFKGTVDAYISTGENSIAFALKPYEYGTEGEGNVKVGIQIDNLPYQVTVAYNSITENYDYTFDVLGYEVTTTCTEETSLEATIPLVLAPENDALGFELSYADRFGTTEGTYDYSGTFTATLTAENIPANEYDVVFHLNKGDLKNIKRQTVTITVTDEKTAEDYAAIGYDYADSTNGIAAVLNACEYNITYKLNGGSFAAGFETVDSYSSLDENDITLPTAESISKFGYTFDGWYTTDSFDYGTDISVIKGNGEDGGDKTLYAKWNLNTYTISYDFGDGYYYGYYPTTYTVESSTIALPTPYANTTGYEFKGWYTTSDFSDSKITEITAGSKAENLNLYAKYGLISYKIYYNLNDGTNPEDAPDEYYSTDNDITLPTPTRTGYTFDGWYTTSYFSGSSITTITSGSTGDVTVYAKWSLTTYTMTYHDYYADGTNYVTTYTYNDSNQETAPLLSDPEAHNGYTFNMWNLTPDFNSSWYTQRIPYQSTGNLDLYPEWNVITYSIAYNTNGSTMPASAAASYNIESETITLEAPETAPDGCVFDSWYTTSDFQTGTEITEITTGTYGDIDLYAKYTVTGYTITYNVNGGTMPETYAIAFSGSIDISLPTPELHGYTFEGWYTTSTFEAGTEITQIDAGTDTNIEVWAKWELITIEWTLTSSESYTFTQSGYVWTSNNKNKSSTSATATWTIILEEAAEVSIPYSVSSESGWDKLTITLDGVTKVSAISGSKSGTISETLTAGTHTLSATYAKDSSGNDGNDCGTVTLNKVTY